MSSIRILTSTDAGASDWRSDEPAWADDRLDPVSASSSIIGALIGLFALAALILMATITFL